MGATIELKTGDYNTIKNQLIDEFNITEVDLLEKILLSFGDKIDNTYILLNNEYDEESNSYYGVSEFIDKYFKADSFDVFLRNMTEGTANVNAYDVADNLGVELPDDD